MSKILFSPTFKGLVKVDKKAMKNIGRDIKDCASICSSFSQQSTCLTLDATTIPFFLSIQPKVFFYKNFVAMGRNIKAKFLKIFNREVKVLKINCNDGLSNIVNSTTMNKTKKIPS